MHHAESRINAQLFQLIDCFGGFFLWIFPQQHVHAEFGRFPSWLLAVLPGHFLKPQELHNEFETEKYFQMLLFRCQNFNFALAFCRRLLVHSVKWFLSI